MFSWVEKGRIVHPECSEWCSVRNNGVWGRAGNKRGLGTYMINPCTVVSAEVCGRWMAVAVAFVCYWYMAGPQVAGGYCTKREGAMR